MKLGIMQPYFFPHLGYFDLINYTDKWIVFDVVQYLNKQWMNRNRILHPKHGWQYVIVPIKKHHRSTLIKDIELSSVVDYGDRILGQIDHYKKQAPFFKEVRALLESCFVEKDSLLKLNVFSLQKTCQYMGIKLDYKIFSEMGLSVDKVNAPGDWAFYISKLLGAKEYVNPSGGAKLFDRFKFESANIKLTIREPVIMEYRPREYEFIPGLSIIDVLMWNSPESVLKFLKTRDEK